LRRENFASPRRARVYRVVGRLRPGVTIAQARGDLASVAAGLSREFPNTNDDTGIGISSLAEWLRGPHRNPLGLAAFAGAILLLIALANGGLMAWASLAEREREMAVQRALGAPAGWLLADTAIDAAVVTMAALAVAVPIGAAALEGAPVSEVSGPASLSAGAIALVSLSTFAGLAAVSALALRAVLTTTSLALPFATRAHATALPRGGRSATALQVALTFALALAAVAAARGFERLATVPTGIQVDGALAATVTLRGPRFADDARIASYFQSALARIRQLPGVSAAGATSLLPLHGVGWTSFVWIPGLGVENVEIRHREISDGYAAAAGLRVIAGREFDPTDDAAAPVLLVNEAFVERIARGRSPLEQSVTYAAPNSGARRWRIVGVVGDTRLDARDAAMPPMIYQPQSVAREETMTVVVRAPRAPTLASMLNRILREVDPEAVVLGIEPLDRAVLRPLARDRATAQLASLVAFVAILLAAIGLYAVVALELRRQRPELAIRIALGAEPAAVGRLLWRRGLGPVVGGLAAGILLGAAAIPAVRSRFSVIDAGAADFAVAAAAVLLATGLAILPNVRAARRTDPTELLKPV
jgi:putative ABC transport system permease protein